MGQQLRPHASKYTPHSSRINFYWRFGIGMRIKSLSDIVQILCRYWDILLLHIHLPGKIKGSISRKAICKIRLVVSLPPFWSCKQFENCKHFLIKVPVLCKWNSDWLIKTFQLSTVKYIMKGLCKWQLTCLILSQCHLSAKAGASTVCSLALQLVSFRSFWKRCYFLYSEVSLLCS